MRIGLQVPDFSTPRGPERLGAELDILRQHCEAVGRDYDTIYKTAYYPFDTRKGAAQIVDELGALAELGFDAAIGAVIDVWDVTPLELIGSEIIPVVADL
jgi:hypothetical protein